MLIEKDKSRLIIIDVQDKLVSVMPKPHKFIDNIIKLQKAANTLAIPIVCSEQYPKGLGRTVKKIKENIKSRYCLREKVTFSLSNKDNPEQNLPEAAHCIITGVEAHVCVLQTAVEVADDKRNVYVVQDAVSSRYENDYLMALSRLDKHPNIQIVSCEMVLFEWLRSSDHPDFKAISQLIK